MSHKPLHCAYCFCTPVEIEAPCPQCGVYLTEILPPGVQGVFHARAWLDLVQAEDARCIALIRAISAGAP